MEIQLRKQGFMLVPETDLEEELIEFLFGHNHKTRVSVKHGTTPSHTTGLVVDWVEEGRHE